MLATECSTLTVKSLMAKQEEEGIVVSCEIIYLRLWQTIIVDFHPSVCRIFEDPDYCENSGEKTLLELFMHCRQSSGLWRT